MPKPLTITERLERFTPIVCRLLARKTAARGGVEALTDEEIAAGSGLPVPTVATLSRKHAWTGVPFDTVLAFTRGCGIHFDDRDSLRHHSAYMRRLKSAPRYLRRSPAWVDTFQPLITAWARNTAK